ncbi:glycine/betaine ABC transporter substrate-binding protein [Petralouisia muris]|uniref:Glycine/betaine ABC transporter substrate-binding protein n=1 Tax=Petralouisia muris TaxID=3032872 RepID=A0AC61S2E0_9FIRM|nr:glycine betaine ABC transporter substrate-binding protein [Petralouisia muris]TGY98401.1 glycine/betaine ABC transporter substrate-binding protein [Petralouisia muris]
MKTRKFTALLLCAVSLFPFLLSGCGKSDQETIRIGSKDFTESLIVAEIYALALEDNGYKVDRKLNVAGSLVHTAITDDEFDLYPEYTGTALLSVLQMDMDSDPDSVYQTVKEEYEKQFNLTWLDSTQVNDRNGIAIRKEAAQEYNISTMSELQANADKLKLCSQGEFEQREDGLPGLAKVYGEFNFASINLYDSGLKYQILENGEADVCPAYSTDAQLVNTDKFAYLEDDKQFWPPYYMAPVVRNDTLEKNPEIAEILNKVSAKLDTETMISLNAKVDIDKQEYDEVAKEFYDSIRE